MAGFVITQLDLGPAELESELPIRAEALRVMPGSDRPDYVLARLERPIRFRTPVGFDATRAEERFRGRDAAGDFVVVQGIVVCARFVGQRLSSGMKDLTVNIAYVIDNSLANDPSVDFGKVEFAAIGYIDDDDVAPPAA